MFDAWRKWPILSGILGVSLLQGASIATAATTTSYSGTECMQEGAIPAQGPSNLVYHGSEVYNYASSSKSVTCPAVQHGGRVLSAFLSGHNWYGLPVTCTLHLHDRFFNTFTGIAITRSTTAATTYTLSFGSTASFFSQGTKFFQCTLQGILLDTTVSIASYTITEE